VLEALMRKPFPTDPVLVATLYGYVLAVTVLIGALPIFWELSRHGLLTQPGSEPPEPSSDSASPETRMTAAPLPAGPRLLNRLPVAKRGAILALSMEDHYVRVFTAAGESLVLLRLSDAIAEVQEVSGFQIHRSHWVARAAVARMERLPDGRLRLYLMNGSVLPVSRTFAKQVREVGLEQNQVQNVGITRQDDRSNSAGATEC
jgi:hypothetical protein